MLQKVIGILLLVLGAAYGALIVSRALREKEAFRSENGNLKVIGPLEFVFYFIATLGLSDFLMQTLMIRGLKLADDKKIPGTLIAASVTPGAVIACFLLQAKDPVGIAMLLLCTAAIVPGAIVGAKIVGRIDGSRIRPVMAILLIVSMAALILKMIISESATGSVTALSGWKLAAAVAFAFLWGVINMLGIPMKAAGTAVFLLLGLSPVAALTMVLVMGCAGPLGGSYEVYKQQNYHQKTAFCSVIFGSAGAVLGSAFALSVDPLLLNILMLIMMLIAIISLLKPAKAPGR